MNTNKHFNRMLAVVMTVVMLMTMLPTTALAAQTESEQTAATEGAAYVAKVGDSTYDDFDQAIAAANQLTGEVTVEIHGKVEYTDATANLTGAYDKVVFVGKTADAEISITRNGSNGYISGVSNDCAVAFEDLTLSKPAGGFASDAGFMNVAFTVYRVGSVSYTDCYFANGACAAGCETTYIGCTFKRSNDKYGLWAYGADVTVDKCVFDDYRGIKMYAEGAAKTTALTVTNTNFSALDSKPAIVLTYGESVTLEGNTYSSTGVFELDLDGAPNGTAVTSDVSVTCKNDNGACGVLVDGKIYTTVAQAAAVATEGSTVTLLHSSTETVELAEGVTLDKNGFAADGVTVVGAAVAKIGQTGYPTLQAAVNAVKSGETIELTGDLTEEPVIIETDGLAFAIDGKGFNFTGGFDIGIGEKLTIQNVNFVATQAISPDYFIDSFDKNSNVQLIVKDCTFTDTDFTSVAVGTHQPTSVVIDGCTGTGLHSLLQNQGGYNITVRNSTVTGKRGMALGTVVGANVDNVTINAADDKYGIRLDGEITNNTVTIKDCRISAFIPVVVRDAVVENYTLVFDGTNTMTPANADGLWCAIGSTEYETNGTMPTDPTGKVTVTLNDTGLDTDGLYGAYEPAPTGTVTYAYTKEVDGSVRVWGEGKANASESYVLELYSDETKIATTTLNNVGGIIDGDVYVTWNFFYPSSNDAYWTTTWEEGHPNSAAQPTKVVLYADGVAVAENEARMSGTDNLNPVTWRKLGGVAVADLAGEGTAENPYLVETLEELKWFRDDVNAGNTYKKAYVKLTADIDLTSEANWTPIGNSTYKFQGVFDGGNHTISNLVINTPSSSNVGLFGFTTDGEIKNLTVNNAKVTGRLNVGVVAGTPYTSKYTDITVTGHIEVNGMAYVGGVGGKNAYNDWTNITVNADSTSYVKAVSTEDGVAYRTYVGGVIGFIGEGSHTFTNITSNIAVYGDVCDVGGITGIAHYNNSFVGVSCSGNVTNTSANADDARETGGIAGTWHNQTGTTVTFEDCAYTGTVSAPNAEGVVFDNGALIGSAYSASGEGEMVIDYAAYIGTTLYETLPEAVAAAKDGDTIVLMSDVALAETLVLGTEGAIVINGNGKTIAQAAEYTDKENALILLGATGAGDDQAATHNYTFNNVVFDGVDAAGWSIIRAEGVTLTMDGCTVQNCSNTQGNGLLRLESTKAVIKNTAFADNKALSAISHNYNSDASESELTVDNCVFDSNEVTGTGVVYYVTGSACTVSDSEFIGNTVTSIGNAATLYAGFNDMVTVTGNLFQNNVVATSHATSKRVAGGLFVGAYGAGVTDYTYDISGNAFVNNSATINNGAAAAASAIAFSDYEDGADLSGNYWGGTEPTEGAQLTIEENSYEITISDYYTDYSTDEDGNIVLAEEDKVEILSLTLEGSGTQADPYLVATKADLANLRDMVNAGNSYKGECFVLSADIDLTAAAAAYSLRDTVTANWTPIGTKDNPFSGTFDGNGKTISNLIVVGEANQGLFGFADLATIQNVTIVNATVVGTDCVGAVAGQVYSSSLIDNCHVSGSILIEGQTNVGGIVGKYYTKVTNCSVIGDSTATSYVKGIYVESDLEGDNVGGIMGHCGENNTLTGNTVKNITISGTRKVGGIVGIADQNTDVNNNVVENVVIETTATAEYAASKVTSMSIGGLIGQYQAATANNDGTVTGNSVKSVTFTIPDGITCQAGTIVGGARGGTDGMLAPSADITASENQVAAVTGATNGYLLPPVAQVGGTSYVGIDEAIANWTAGTTLTLLSNVTLSDAITLKSTEHHILNLGTYTMTAAEGKHAILITANGVGTTARSCLTIHADSENPGGITATGKSCIYYNNADKIADRLMVTINGGVFNGSYAVNSTSGPLNNWGFCTSPLRGQGAPYYVINGGTFDAQVYLNAAMLKVTGGTFNKNLTCMGDSTAHRVISGGTFKSMTMTADAEGKFTIGSAQNSYDTGLYVDDNGYLVVGGPVITEPGETFEASSTNYSGWSSYLQYSSAKTNSLYYTSVEEALADNNKATGSVTIYTDELDLTSTSYEGTLNLPEEDSTLAVTFTEGTEPTWSVAAGVEGMEVIYTDSVTDGVVTRTYTLVKAVAKIGDVKYASLTAAAAAAVAGDTITMLTDTTLSETVELPAGITFNGGGKTITGTIKAGGDLTFAGATTVGAFNPGGHNNTITIGEGARLKVTDNRMTVSYGNKFNITGSVADAKQADKAALTASLELVAGISFNGDGGGVQMNITNAYVILGDSSTKNSGATGTFNINVTNSVVDFTKTLKTYMPTADDLAPEVSLAFKDSAVNFASHLELWLDKTVMTLDNTDLTVGGSFANAGTVNVENGAYLLVKAPIMSSHGGNTGTICADGGTFELADSNQDWENAGTMRVTTDGKLITNDFKCVGEGRIVADAAELAAGSTVTVVDGNGAYDFSGVVTVENGTNVTVGYENGDVTMTRPAFVASGKVSYRAYISDEADREAIKVDLENVNAAQSVIVKLFDAQGNLLVTTTYASGACQSAALTTNIVIEGRASGSWNTVWEDVELTAANKPETIQLWIDGVVMDTFVNALGTGTNVDKTADYMTLDSVKCEASVTGSESVTYYTTLTEAFVAAAEGETITLLADVTLTETITLDKALTLELNGKTVTGADGAVVFNVKAATTIRNGVIVGNKSGTSSGILDIYANLTMDSVSVETSKINALRFKSGECTAVLTNCQVTGAFKGYGGSVWEIKSGTYKASSTAISEQLNGTSRISGGTFHYEIAEEQCASGYQAVDNGNGTWTVEYVGVACFVDANGNGTQDEGEVGYSNLDQLFANHQEGTVNVVLTSNIVAKGQVDTDVDAVYNFTTDVAEGVTMDFQFAEDWNYIQKMSLGENITLNSRYLLAWTDLDVHGTINTGYAYFTTADVTIHETGVLNASANDATVQVKNGAVLTVKGEVNTHTVNVWVGESELIVSGESARVNAAWVDIWDGTPNVTVENGAVLTTDAIKASRGGVITVDDATLDADNLELGHNGESAGVLTVINNGSTTGQIKLTAADSTVSGSAGMNVTTDLEGYEVVYDNGVYRLAAVETVAGTIHKVTKTLSLNDEVFINLYGYTTGFEGVDLEQNLGILVWSYDATRTAENADLEHTDGLLYTAQGAQESEKDGAIRYRIQSQGIPAKNVGDTLQIRLYVEVAEGEYVYSDELIEYSPAQYAYNAIASDSASEEVKNMSKALLNYAAAAQVVLDYAGEGPANQNLAPADQEMDGVLAWNDGYLTEVEQVDPTLVADLAADSSVFIKNSRTLVLEDMIRINFKYIISGSYSEYGIMFWSQDDYAALKTDGTALNRSNATVVVEMEQGMDGRYIGSYPGIAAKNMGDAVYACAYVVDGEGNISYSGVDSYSIETYAANAIASASAPDTTKLMCKWMVIYGELAKNALS